MRYVWTATLPTGTVIYSPRYSLLCTLKDGLQYDYCDIGAQPVTINYGSITAAG